MSPDKQNKAPSRALTRICKANQYHSNNKDQLKKLEDQIKEKRAVFHKKPVTAANQFEYQKTKKLFELNRSAFYRKLDEDQKEMDENIDVDQVITFWRGIWATDEEEGEQKELIDLLDPGELQTEAEEERVKRVIKEKIKFLTIWKTPGPDGIFSSFIKKVTALHFCLTASQSVDDPARWVLEEAAKVPNSKPSSTKCSTKSTTTSCLCPGLISRMRMIASNTTTW